MASLTYSSNALDTLPKFHRKRFVIYVEGQDDILFWNIIFRKYGFKSIQIKQAGGVTEVNKYADSIVNDNANIIVARDADYSRFLKTQKKHPKIIYTYGYSIENSLYCPDNVSSVISTHARNTKNYKKEVARWINEFGEKNRELLALDLANEMYGKGVQVMGSNCCRFLTSNTSCVVDDSKVQTHTKTIEKNFLKAEVIEAKNKVAKVAKQLYFFIRGHFLTHAVINFIKTKVRSESGRSVTFSDEHLFAILISTFEAKCMSNRDVLFIERQINNLKTSLGM